MADQEKFNSCTYKSAEKHISIETWCCGSKETSGYLCSEPHLLIDNVTPEICEQCTYYVEKEKDS